MGKILALDIATTTGWCLLDGEVKTGVVKLAGERGEKALQLRKWLERRVCYEGVELVAFEEPLFFRGHGGTLLTGLQVTVEMVCEELQVPYVSVAVSTLKKFATGHGGASKSEMVSAAERAGGLLAPTSHEADAFWTAKWALERVDIGEGE